MVHICHIFLIHSSVNGYAGCFHTLAIANNVPMNIGMHVSFQISISSLALFFGRGGYIPGSGIAESYDSSTSRSLSHLHTLSLWLHRFIFRPRVYPGLPFSSHCLQH